MNFRKILSILTINILILNLTSISLACWGTRPLAMGGAFTGIADDVNAIYWNPAGLALITRSGITTMHNAGERNESNYDHYLGFALPVNDYSTMGGAFVYNKDILYNANRNKIGDRKDAYYQIGYGAYLEKRCNLSIGINFKAVTKDENATTYSDQDEWVDVDIGTLWTFGNDVGKKKMFSVGFLLQNASEAQFLKRDDATKMIRNLRPGIGFRPDEKTTLSLEIYDAFRKTRHESEDVSQDVRLGIERWISENVALRLGGYHINNESLRAYTGGIGLKVPASWNINLELDYTIMYWDHADTSTQFVGLTYLF